MLVMSSLTFESKANPAATKVSVMLCTPEMCQWNSDCVTGIYLG